MQGLEADTNFAGMFAGEFLLEESEQQCVVGAEFKQFFARANDADIFDVSDAKRDEVGSEHAFVTAGPCGCCGAVSDGMKVFLPPGFIVIGEAPSLSQEGFGVKFDAFPSKFVGVGLAAGAVQEALSSLISVFGLQRCKTVAISGGDVSKAGRA